eukprot:scaffold34931_cov175-Amphora_coffeaeformis.AAC.1
MDPQQQQATILRAIAISSIYSPSFTQNDRQAAFKTLEELKKYDGRVQLVLQWLLAERHLFEQHDITIQTKLLALEILASFLEKGYSNLSEQDRLQLREIVLKSARLVVASPLGGNQESRIFGKKLAVILAGLVLRDFPQRWTTFATDVFKTLNEGGLWYNQPGEESIRYLDGVHICLEAFKLIAEDCTDADYNARISTQRRNDVLIGLNEVSKTFLPLIFQILEKYPLLQQAKVDLHSMHMYLIQNNRTVASLNDEERSQYQSRLQLRQYTAQVIEDTLVTLSRFCASMPMVWMTGEGVDAGKDFIAAFLHLIREPYQNIQVRAVECLEQLLLRGKLEYAAWMRIVTELPLAVGEANNHANQNYEFIVAEQRASDPSSSAPDPIAIQFDYHRALSKTTAACVSSGVAHINSSKQILSLNGLDFERVQAFLDLMVNLLAHPSGRICSEQLNMWVMMLRDPQISKAHILRPFAQRILTAYMNQAVRIRWDDVEEETHPHSQILSASFDDEEDYDSWMADLRSRSSLLYKFMANTEPAVCSSLMLQRLTDSLAKHGDGKPLDHLEPENGQLTQKSDAVLQFEGIHLPMEYVLGGIPSWAVDSRNTAPSGEGQVAETIATTTAALAGLSQAAVSWAPTFLWLKFRRATLLEPLKHIWKYEPSTLLQGIDSLIRYLGLADEWQTPNSANTGENMSDEIVGLKKKSGVTLVAVAKHVPQHLVPWLTQLSDATGKLLSSDGLIPMNQMHLYEFLSCVATAVEDPVARSTFIGNVLSNPVEILLSTEIQQQIMSEQALLSSLGVLGAAENPNSVSDGNTVSQVTGNYNRLFTSLNRLLSVGKRCSEAARKQGGGITGINAEQCSGIPPGQQNFPDEGPLSIQTLAVTDPFTPLWPKILLAFLKIFESTMGIWKPEFQAIFLRHQYQRYVYAISDDEAFLSKNHDKSAGGVFGEGGTAGSIVSGISRRDINLLPKWSGWFNELRNTCFQMVGILATERAMFAPEISEMYPRLVAVVASPELLRSMEHRHMTQYLKHIVELIMVCCPSSLYSTHLAPFLSPILEHVRWRLEMTWSPVIGSNGPNESAKALSSEQASAAADLAARGGEDWYKWYYAHAGLFVGDLDAVTSEAVVEKHRVDLSRAFADVLQVALALKGPWALVLANMAKDEQAAKNSTKSSLGPRSRLSEEGAAVNADGTPKATCQNQIDARKLGRINGLCSFLILENPSIAWNLIWAVVQCLGYPDAYTVRRITKICHRILETAAWSPQYTDILSNHMFKQAIRNVVTEPKWMVGIEWDMINVIRDIYCRLVLGQALLPGGQGPAIQMNSAGESSNRYEQAKTVDRPLQGGGILTVSADSPRRLLADIPGIGVPMVEKLEQDMKTKLSAKDQKDLLRDLLRIASDNVKDIAPGANSGGIFTRANEAESLLHTRKRTPVIPALPEKLVTQSQIERAKQKERQRQEEPDGLSAFFF